MTPPLPLVEWKQEHDPSSNAPYWLCLSTNTTQWEEPTAGVVECTDPTSGFAFFQDAASKATGWTLFELSLQMDGGGRSTPPPPG